VLRLAERERAFDLAIAMAILCLGNRSLHLDGYGFIGELALEGSVRPVTGVLPMARCLRAAGVVRHLAVAEENAAEAALVDSLAVIGVSSLQRCVAPYVADWTACCPYLRRRGTPELSRPVPRDSGSGVKVVRHGERGSCDLKASPPSLWTVWQVRASFDSTRTGTSP
jgi:hypothetical protein